MKVEKIRIILLALLFGAVGIYFIVNSYALSKMICTPPNGGACKFAANPPLSAGCGYDIALLGDRSASMATRISAMINDMKNFVSTMENTNSQFAVGDLGPTDPISAFTGDVATAHSVIDRAGMYADQYRDYRIVNQMDKRPNHQNLIILFTDTVNTLMPETSADIVKQSGTRIIIVRYITTDYWGDADDPEWTTVTTYLAGPEDYTGSILNANIVFSTGHTKIADYATALAARAKQPCSPPVKGSDPGSGNNPGTGGNPGTNPGGGPGNGSGPGKGAGSNGSGTGNDGSGQGNGRDGGTSGGGGGSNSNQSDDKSNPLPSPTGQGNNKQPDIEPSPFFDGKLFAIGSDADTEDIKGVSIAGQKFGLGWVYLAIILAVVSGLLALYFLWWRRMSAKNKEQWKAKLRLR